MKYNYLPAKNTSISGAVMPVEKIKKSWLDRINRRLGACFLSTHYFIIVNFTVSLIAEANTPIPSPLNICIGS